MLHDRGAKYFPKKSKQVGSSYHGDINFLHLPPRHLPYHCQTLSFSIKESEENNFLVHLEEFLNVHNSDGSSNTT